MGARWQTNCGRIQASLGERSVTVVKLFIFSLILTMSVCAPAMDAQANSAIQLPTDDSVHIWLQNYRVPVVAIGIIEGGKPKATKVYGNLGENVPAPANTIFQVASLTKCIATMTALRLVATGQWRLDEPLYKYWIDPDLEGDIRYKLITTRLVLTHRTGLPNYRFNTPTRKLTIDFIPGSRFQYSGEGYEYLREALEHKFHRTLSQLAAEILFEPLGMKDTRFTWDKGMDEAIFAAPTDANGRSMGVYKRPKANAADGLMTTISDYTKFGAYVLSGAGLPIDLYRQMTTVYVHYDALPAHRSMGEGLGWAVLGNLPNGEYSLFHEGSDDGAKTLIFLLPESKRGIVVFTNGENGFKVIAAIMRSSLEFGDRLPSWMPDLQ